MVPRFSPAGSFPSPAPSLSLAVGALLLVAALVGGTAGVGSAGGGSVGPVGAAVSQETPQPPAVDNTVTRIELASDGSARWTVTIRTRLDTEEDVRAYEAFQSRFRENTSRFLDPFRTRIRSVVANAADATGREMAARNFTASTHIQEVPRQWGVVTYAFTWTGFAAVEGETVRVGDAFAGGFFLAANDTLTVVVPAGYAVTRVEPAPSDRGDGSVSWTGRVDFADGRPQVHAAPPGGGNGGGDGPATRLPDAALLGAGVALLALLAGLAALAYHRRGEPASAPTTATDEERVLELLESRGGRVPQAAVVEAFDWSTSKTSRVLTRMADEGTIEKLQLGRENLIRLPDDGD